jgi:lysyl-tRNA synthetase class 2
MMDRAMTDAGEWRPAARPEILRLRAALLRRVRDYFAAQGVMEVETPVLSQATVTDPHLASLRTRIKGHGEFFLQTSPEYAMKRLLAAGLGDIFQIARVFRDAERGALHNPEFTLIEWYRVGFNAAQLMTDAARLLNEQLAARRPGPAQFLTYREAIVQYAGVDPFKEPIAGLFDCLRTHGVSPPWAPAVDRDACLDLLMSTVVGPKLGAGALCFVHDYPATQAALARLKPGDPAVAERFEIYFDGVELANGFHELGDAQEQRARFERDLQARRARGLEAPAFDERLLAALTAGLPDCSGVALGFDRLVMLAAGVQRIDEVLAYPVERA